LPLKAVYTAERSWKNSPDCSGYAIVQRGHFEAKAIAFERKAGVWFV